MNTEYQTPYPDPPGLVYIFVSIFESSVSVFVHMLEQCYGEH